MYASKALLLFLLLLCPFPEASAQQYRLYARRYGIEEGMPHRQVNSVIQDRRGFIWAATMAGVVRFDGQRFRIFNKTDNGLSGDVVDWVAEDADGYIWVFRYGPNAWFDIIDPVSGKIIHSADFFKDHPIPLSLKRLEMPPFKTSDGSLVLGFNLPGGWLQYHPSQGWKMVNVPACSNFQVIQVNEQQEVWATLFDDDPYHMRLVKMDANGTVLQHYTPASGNSFYLKKGSAGEAGGFFIMEGNAEVTPVLWEIKPGGMREQVPILGNFAFTRNGSRLEGSGIQIQFPQIFDKDNRLLLDLSRQFPEIDAIQFRDYLLDKSGNIWFATAFGLLVVEIRQDLFKRLLFDEKAPGGRGFACRGLLEKNGNLIVNVEARGQGRFLVNPSTGKSKQIAGEDGVGIAASSDGNIWTDFDVPSGGWGYTSITKTSPDGVPMEPFLFQKKINGAAWAILEENPQRVLLGHANGITVFNPQTGAATEWPADKNHPEFYATTVTFLNRDRAGHIWACTDQGLYRLNQGGGLLGRYWSGGIGAWHLPYDNLYHFHEDADGVFWIATGGGGLIRWQPPAEGSAQKEADFVQITRKNGLLNNVVYAAYEDKHAHLWLPTDYGIVQLDKKTLQVRRTWLTEDGVTNNEFNRISHCQGAGGTLYFGGLNGVTAFQPDEFYTDVKAGKGKSLVVSDFKVLRESSGQLENLSPELLASGQITMLPGDRYIQLEFALLDFVAPEKVTYTWKIEGIAKDWETIKEPVLRLSSLPYGVHRLRIRAQSADGVMADNELDIRLEVLAPFYMRWWFIALVAALLVIGVWFWLQWRVREHRQEQERLETEVQRQTATILQQTQKLTRLDEAKSRFFANISHELRTPLTLLLGPLGSMLKGKRLEQRDFKYAGVAHQHGKQLLHLVNEILDLSKMESGKMSLQETTFPLRLFLHRVVSAFESHAERLGILFVLENQVAERLQVLADADKVQKIINNLLSNALKFTPAHSHGSVSVRIETINNLVRIGVHDSGRGIHADDLPHVFERFYQTSQSNAPIEGGTGIGLALCREFVDLMQGRIWVESAPGAGSSFYVEFPLKEVSDSGNMEYELPEDPFPEEAEDGVLNAALSVPLSDKNLAQTILLVEDNDSMRDYVKSILGEKYRVITAENGQIALDILISKLTEQGATALPNLIISDIMMPVMDGFQLLTKLKNDERWRHLPVVMLTARADIRDKLRALRTGVDDYLLKPFEEDELLARVENLLRHAESRYLQPEGDPEPPVISRMISAEDQAWLEDFEKLVEKRLGDFDITAEMLAEAMAMSRSPFFRRLKRLTGLTPAQYLDEARFQKARRMFESRQGASVKSVAYNVGFRQVKHFSQNYRKRFGKLPSEYV